MARVLNARPIFKPFSKSSDNSSGNPLNNSPNNCLEQKWEQRLAQAGIEMFSLPLLDFVPEPYSTCSLGESPPDRFEGVFVSSPRGLQFFRESLKQHPLEWERWLKNPLYTLSEGVEAAAKELGFEVGFRSKKKITQRIFTRGK